MARNKYPEETTQKILEAALKIFLEKGYEKTTVLDIVSAMGGLTRGAFYHHFKSKEEVFDAVGDKLFFDNNPFEKAKLRTDLSGLEKLQELLASSLENTDVRKVNVMTIQVFTSPTLLWKLIENNRRVSKMFEEFIREGVQDGSIKTEHPKLLAELIPLLTNLWMVPTLYPSTPQESEERFLYIKKNISDFRGVNSADYLSALTNDVKNIEDNYLSPLLLCLLQCVAFVTSFIVMIYLSPIVTVCLLVTMFIVIIVIIVPSLFNRSIQKKQDSFSKKTVPPNSCNQGLFVGIRGNPLLQDERPYSERLQENEHTLFTSKYALDKVLALVECAFDNARGPPSSAVSCSWQHI